LLHCQPRRHKMC